MKPIYLLVLIPIFFVAMWAGVTTLLAFLSGWTALARAYRGSLASVAGSASPPLLIPWSDMAECRSYRALGMFERFGFRPACCDVKIALAGSAARLLTEELAGASPQRPALATA